MTIEKQFDASLAFFVVIPGTVFSLLTPYCEFSFGYGPVCLWSSMEVAYGAFSTLYGILLFYLFWIIIPFLLLALIGSTYLKLRNLARHGWAAIVSYPFGYIVLGLTIAHLAVAIFLLALSFSYALPPLTR